jgi:transposase
VLPEPEVLVPKRKGHGRKPNPANLPRRREEIDLSEAEKVCPCCAGVRIRIGESIRERLDYTPSSVFVREIAQQRYACRSCEQAARDPQIAAPAFPPEPVPKSGVGAGLLAQVIVSKCVDHRVQGEAVHEMRVGLSRSGCRTRSQTTGELRRLRAVVGSVLGKGVA